MSSSDRTKPWLGHLASAAAVISVILTIHLSVLQPLAVAAATESSRRDFGRTMERHIDNTHNGLVGQDVLQQMEKRLEGSLNALGSRLDRIETKVDALKKD